MADFQAEAESALGSVDKKLFFIGLTNMKKNKWFLPPKATAQESLYVTKNDLVPRNLEETLLTLIGEKQSTGGMTSTIKSQQIWKMHQHI